MARSKLSRSMSTTAKTPDAYVSRLRGWRRECVEHLRTNAHAAGALDEELKWGHLVLLSNGPVLFIRAEPKRILLGFWRGQRLVKIEPLLKPGGKYEMATLAIASAPFPSAAKVKRLVKQAIAMNRKLGNPWDDAGTR
jgi:hypothetical protein